jgi:hypothetical protein
VENTLLHPRRPWPYSGPVGLDLKIVHGISIGLSILQGLKPAPNLPGIGITLLDFISSILNRKSSLGPNHNEVENVEADWCNSEVSLYVILRIYFEKGPVLNGLARLNLGAKSEAREGL